MQLVRHQQHLHSIFWQVEEHMNQRILKIGLVYFVFISFLVEDQEEFGIFGRTGSQEEWEHFVRLEISRRMNISQKL